MSGRYPKQDAEFPSDLELSYQRFADLREDFLLNFGYNTARAYWADLEDILLWCVEHQKDPLCLSEAHLNRYLVTLATAGYSPNTIRRRLTAVRGLQSTLEARSTARE